MTVYVDDAYLPFGRMLMCHMVATGTDKLTPREELDAMADEIGVARRWIQHPGTPEEHYDVAKGARAKAVEAGAVECESEKIVEIIQAKRSAASKYGFSVAHDAVLELCIAQYGPCPFGCAKDGAPNCFHHFVQTDCEPAKASQQK